MRPAYDGTYDFSQWTRACLDNINRNLKYHKNSYEPGLSSRKITKTRDSKIINLVIRIVPSLIYIRFNITHTSIQKVCPSTVIICYHFMCIGGDPI